ncbi:pyridoxamine 5'-phosphate oxidase family protein [Stieleria varia]|uniref:Pyridoxamine 5'-phosphate oxidase n=1 Tax=Stieleria varia TaxID=2528005 RepID=A0A5C5ZZE3_9BACT|nr:pyridoxamine 5'-phosphate oxidase family protein [Stieleria varia]TWT92427.1 Pyridoxamine 5'-phosphate oxidase [Stieleria varia]
MGKVYPSIDEKLRDFIEKQHVFFVATAPRSDSGLVNLSPKGLDSLRILDERTVVYADLVGSGIETAAHVQENGRIVLMFCAFAGPPKIVRLHGRGEVIPHVHADYPQLENHFPQLSGLRCFIRIDCHRISDSCGFGVPLFEYQGQRSQLTQWASQKSLQSLNDYIEQNNRESLDGLPGLSPDMTDGER